MGGDSLTQFSDDHRHVRSPIRWLRDQWDLAATTRFEDMRAQEPSEDEVLSLPWRCRIGLVDVVLNRIETQLEADPLAIASILLTYFGNAMGSKPHVQIGPQAHGGNVYTVLVGDSSSGRKGEAARAVSRIFEHADPYWAANCIQGGFASGEAVIAALAESADPRRLVLEHEQAATLARAGREGSILSAVLRNGFDGGPLENRRAGGMVVAKGHHVSSVGMITPEELGRSLTTVEASNGYGSRHLWLRVQRQRRLPFGGDIPDVAWASLGDEVGACLEEARRVDVLEWTDDGRSLWKDLYARTPDVFGLARALLSRRETIMLRLAIIYALSDGRRRIDVDHVIAASALWERSVSSVKTIWQQSTGDPLADAVLVELRHRSLTQTEVRQVLGHNYSAARIQDIVDVLLGTGLVDLTERKTAGRPAQVLSYREPSPEDFPPISPFSPNEEEKRHR
ncbi:MAG TPA: DUF3987 domain-containing protein [Acidimicrobiia bacterium]